MCQVEFCLSGAILESPTNNQLKGSWQEILKWEKKFHCECQDIGLLKFQGKPDKLSPKGVHLGMIF